MKKGDIIRKKDSHLLGVVRRVPYAGPREDIAMVVWLKVRRDLLTDTRTVVYRRGKPVFWGDTVHQNSVEILEEA